MQGELAEGMQMLHFYSFHLCLNFKGVTQERYSASFKPFYAHRKHHLWWNQERLCHYEDAVWGKQREGATSFSDFVTDLMWEQLNGTHFYE